MAKAIYVCARREFSPHISQNIGEICTALAADNITSAPARVHRGKNTIFGVVNPNRLMEERRNSLLLGAIFGEQDRWHHPGSALPDGSYALFRENEDAVEIVCDPGGSRTIWYYWDDDQFVASTSQQAIVMYLGSFVFNPEVIAWMLSTSGLGPNQSWDKRIRRVGPDSSVTLDKRSWSLKQRSEPIEFVAQEKSDKAHRREVKDALHRAFESVDLDLSQWALPLSGGYDSRSILAFFDEEKRDLEGLQAITWGTKEALRHPNSDACIARRVAEHYGVDHRYFALDEEEKPAAEVVDRFLHCGEGRVDHIAGYLDGFETWRALFDEGIKGTIRGDEGFGLKVKAVSSPLTVRLSVRFGLCSDFSNLKGYEHYGLPRQEIPEALQLRTGESLSTWRDRLFHQYKLPVIVAALTDVKSPYLDQVNPLLSRGILQAMRTLPDHLRDEKILFREIVDAIGPNLPIATRSASVRTRQAVLREDLLALIERELRSDHARAVLPAGLVDEALENLLAVQDAATNGGGFVLRLKQHVREVGSRLTPRPLKNILVGNAVRHHMDVTLLAWRLALISRMTTRLQQAARAGAQRVQTMESPRTRVVG